MSEHHPERSEWTRERQSFSCTDDIWNAAKHAWADQLDEHPAWTDWLETAIAEAVDTTHALHGGQLASAPARIPPGRRDGTTAGPPRRRRSFTCQPHIWAGARDAWWTERRTYPQLSDWMQAAIATKAGLVKPITEGPRHETH